jgi:hypothetical protein
MNLKTKFKTSLRRVALWLVLFQTLFPLFAPATAISRTANVSSGPPHGPTRGAEMANILSVLENRTRDRELLEKAQDKLFRLDDQPFWLIVSLSERIAREGKSPGRDIAFLLIMALIILS